MKLDTNMYQDKLPSLEEGPIKYETINEVGGRYNRFIQFMKIVLYLELIVFIGWIGCIFLTNYYQDRGYSDADGLHEVSEFDRKLESQNPSANWNDIPVQADESPAASDEIKDFVEKNEQSTESAIAKKDNSMETEMSTTTTNIETEANNMDDAILLSAWLHTLRGPKDNGADSPSNLDESETSNEETVQLIVDSNGASTTQNSPDSMHKKSNVLPDVNFDDFLTSPLIWPEYLWPSDYKDEITNAHKDSFPDDDFVNWSFDFRLPDLVVERHLSRQTTIDEAQQEDSSSATGEDENDSVSEVKRSINSSSSDEKKNPSPKVKRSTDSSSSESDSSDSSSSENDEKKTKEEKKLMRAMKAAKNGKNCPRIVDDNGDTIDDPKDIANYIKRNWFKWLLDTPIPDCDEPQSAKTVTMDECGKFVIKCTSDDSDETNEATEESGMNYRGTRDVTYTDADWDQCEKSSDDSRENFDGFIMNLVKGESSDPIVNQLRREFRKAVGLLIVQVIVDQTTGGYNRTEQQWLDSLVEIREDIYNLTNAEHQRVLEENGAPTQEKASELRELAESVANISMHCMNVLAKSENSKLRSTAIKLILERAKCGVHWAAKETKEDSLAAELLADESSDSAPLEIRYKLKKLIRELARDLASLEPYDSRVIPSGPVNVTDEQWSKFMVNLKQALVNATEDSSLRQRLEASGLPTEEQTNQLHAIMDYYLRDSLRCSMMSVFGFVGSLRNVQQEANRRKRSVEGVSSPQPIDVNCASEEDDNQFLQDRRARLEYYNSQVTKNETNFGVPLLDTVDAALKAENTSQIVDTRVDYSEILIATNTLIGNSSSSDLWREGYELMRDVIIELQKLDNNDTVWKDENMIKAAENFTSCLMDIRENFTSDSIFMTVVKAAESVKIRYSEDYADKQCNDAFQPVYGHFTYIGEEPENSIVRSWRPIFNEIVKLYFKIYDPEALPVLHCNSTGGKSQAD